MNRRTFLTAITTVLAAATSRRLLAAPETAPATTLEIGERRANGMLYRPLGRTGEKVSALGLGVITLGCRVNERKGFA